MMPAIKCAPEPQSIDFQCTARCDRDYRLSHSILQTMKRVQINGSRFYRIAGQKNLMPSVTTVLSVIGKKFLSRWETNLALGKIRSRVEERIQEGNVDRVTAAEMDAWIQVRRKERRKRAPKPDALWRPDRKPLQSLPCISKVSRSSRVTLAERLIFSLHISIM